MKFSSYVLVAGILLVPFRCAWAQRSVGEDDNFWADQKIKAPTEAMPATRVMAALSQAASINIFVDAAAIPTNITVRPWAKRPYDPFGYPIGRKSVVPDVASQLELSYDRTSTDTVVFWHQPDLNRTINLIAGRQKQLDALYPAAEEKATFKELQKFFPDHKEALSPAEEDAQKRTVSVQMGWPTHFDAEPQSAEKSVSVAQLPPELRRALQAEFVRRLRVSNATPAYQSLELPFWKEGRVLFSKQQYNIYDKTGFVRKNEMLFVGGVCVPAHPYTPGSWFYISEQPAYIGASHAENPHQVELDNFVLPAFMTEGEHLAQFRTEEIATLPAPKDLPPAIDLNADDALQKTVKFSVQKAPLADFVADLARQGKVKLAVAPDVAPEGKVLACSSGMKLDAAMTALERLYGARWMKSETGYLLRSQGLDEVHTTLNQWGLATVYLHEVRNPAQRDAIGAQLADDVSGAFDRDQLVSRKGAPFSELPLDTQSHILQLYREDRSGQLIVTQGRLEDALAYIDNFSIRYGTLPEPEKVPGLFGDFQSEGTDTGTLNAKQPGLAAYTPDGRFITQLFRDFADFKNALAPAPELKPLPPGVVLPGGMVPPPKAPGGDQAP